MRRYAVLFSSLVAMLLGTVGVGSASAACSDVLSYGNTCASGGNTVAVGDIVSAGLSSGTSATFASGFENITCSTANFKADVTANPAFPGTATETLTSLTFSGCASNLGSVTTSTVADGSASVSSSNVVTLNGQKFSFTVAGTTCEWGFSSPTTDTGTVSNTNNSIKFSAIPLILVSGGSLCPATGTETFTESPVLDTSQSNARLFVN